VWWLVAIAAPLIVHAVTVSANVALGAGPPTLAQFQPASGIVLIFAVRLVNPLDGPLAEEPGWRAFAQPQLQSHRSTFVATLILALLVACWHLPLWLLPQFGATPVVIVSDVLATMAVTFWYAWLFNRSGGSALLTLVAHAVEGTIQTERFWTANQAADRTVWLYAAVWCLAAICLITLDRRVWRHTGTPERGPSRTASAVRPKVPHRRGRAGPG
jgi:membrane protease YdiL (CAAX protease family)